MVHKIRVASGVGIERAVTIEPSNVLATDTVKGGKAAFVNVETGSRQANTVEITKGLKQGDSVVVTGVLFARPKSQLKVRGVKTLEQLAN